MARPGIYNERIVTKKAGTSESARIKLQSELGRGTVIITASGNVITLRHRYITLDGLIFDGRYGAGDTVKSTFLKNITSDYLIINNTEVRRSGRDCIDILSPDNVLIEKTLIHHCLWWDPSQPGSRRDAHGIAAGGQGRLENLTIRETEIHTFSGDGLQVDPNRNANGFDNVVIEKSKIWLEPLPQSENGFPAGIVPGENALDTKASNSAPRANIYVNDTQAWGFRNGLIGSMSAFNIKENVAVTLDRVSVWNSEIAFRLRGTTSTRLSSRPTILNAVIYNVDEAIQYEFNLDTFRILGMTIGQNVTWPFYDRQDDWDSQGNPTEQTSPIEIKNLLLLGASLPSPSDGHTPKELLHPSNLAVEEDSFVNVEVNDYHLTDVSAAIDVGEAILELTTDRDGVTRPQGNGYDIGAYEYVS